MAAAAYDVAALALRGEDAILNFKELSRAFPVPATLSPPHIRLAAIEAASRFHHLGRNSSSASLSLPACMEAFPVPTTSETIAKENGTTEFNIPAMTEAIDAYHAYSSGHRLPEIPNAGGGEFMDEDLLFDMPNLLSEMAEGMLLTPPRIGPPPDVLPENAIHESLWSYP